MYRTMFQKKGGANTILEGREFVLPWIILQGRILSLDIWKCAVSQMELVLLCTWRLGSLAA